MSWHCFLGLCRACSSDAITQGLLILRVVAHLAHYLILFQISPGPREGLFVAQPWQDPDEKEMWTT